MPDTQPAPPLKSPYAPSVDRTTLHTDLLILGGGIAGLWTLLAARRAGRHALLVEPTALGTGQTIASQGIIHGGLKYALTGSASAAARAIAAMPQRWAEAMAGADPAAPDLRAAALLSPHYHLFTTGSIGSRLVALAASKVIRTPVQSVPRDQRPPGLIEGPRGLDVYRVGEPVLNPASLVTALAAQASPWLIAGTPAPSPGTAGAVDVTLRDGGTSTIHASAVVLTAGAGNAVLIDALAGNIAPSQQARPRAQVRPLRMALLRAPAAAPDQLPMLFAHAVAASLADKPRLTITSQRDAAGRVVWYIGGLLAEPDARGELPSEPAQQALVARELAACLPWINTNGCEFASRIYHRAEGLDPRGARPDEPVVAAIASTAPGAPRLVVAWPTKLAFAPLVADRVLAAVPPSAAHASAPRTDPPPHWAKPSVAPLPWSEPGLQWTALERG